jgi:hypothetical protein
MVLVGPALSSGFSTPRPFFAPKKAALPLKSASVCVEYAELAMGGLGPGRSGQMRQLCTCPLFGGPSFQTVAFADTSSLAAWYTKGAAPARQAPVLGVCIVAQLETPFHIVSRSVLPRGIGCVCSVPYWWKPRVTPVPCFTLLLQRSCLRDPCNFLLLQRSCLGEPCKTLGLTRACSCRTIHLQPDRFEEAVPSASTQRLSVYYSFRQKSVSTLSVRYKLSRVGFVLMVPLVILAVSFHSWVQLRRSRVCDPCNTLFFFFPWSFLS